MQNGLAQDFERVNSLKRLACFLEGQIYEKGTTGKYHNVWLPDVKVVGFGENAEVVEIERFNSGLLQQFRGTLDDLAKETGGRVHRQQNATIDLSQLTDSQIDRLAKGEDLYAVLATPGES